MNIYVELTHAFNVSGLKAVLSSGQAVVLHKLAVMSKDGDWIVRETDEACALRELAEETGLHGELGPELASTEYVDQKGRPKRVRYWLVEMPDVSPGDWFVPNDEVDAVEWLAPGLLLERLSYEHDRSLVDEAVSQLG